MMLERRPTVAVWLAGAALLVSSCVGRSVTNAAARRSDALGLDAAQRDAFTREVEACLGGKSAESRARAPATTVAIGASGEAPGGSAGGLAAVGVIASAVTVGIVYRAYHWWKARHRDDVSDRRVEARPSPVPRAPGSAEVIASGRSEGDATEATLDSCLATVTQRWRQRLSGANADSRSGAATPNYP
jgi:hypothetical protein